MLGNSSNVRKQFLKEFDFNLCQELVKPKEESSTWSWNRRMNEESIVGNLRTDFLVACRTSSTTAEDSHTTVLIARTSTPLYLTPQHTALTPQLCTRSSSSSLVVREGAPTVTGTRHSPIKQHRFISNMECLASPIDVVEESKYGPEHASNDAQNSL